MLTLRKYCFIHTNLAVDSVRLTVHTHCLLCRQHPSLKLLIDKSFLCKIGFFAALNRTWVAPVVGYWNAENLVWQIHFRSNSYQ
jgi:hypothetical protein